MTLGYSERNWYLIGVIIKYVEDSRRHVNKNEVVLLLSVKRIE